MLVALAALTLARLSCPRPSAVAGVDDWQHTWEVVQLVQGCCRRGTGRPNGCHDLLPRRLHRPRVHRERQLCGPDMLEDRRTRTPARSRRSVITPWPDTTRPLGWTRRSSPGCLATRAGQPMGILLIGVGVSRFIGPPDAAGSRSPSTRRQFQSKKNQPLGTSTTTTGAYCSTSARKHESGCGAGRTAAGPGSSATSVRTSPQSLPPHRGREGQRPEAGTSSTCRSTWPSSVSGLDKPRYGHPLPAAPTWPGRTTIPVRALHQGHRAPELGLLGPSPPPQARVQALAGAALRLSWWNAARGFFFLLAISRRGNHTPSGRSASRRGCRSTLTWVAAHGAGTSCP